VAIENRQAINGEVVLKLLLDGQYPSAQRVLASGGRGGQADVLKDIRETLVDLATRAKRPDAPEEILVLSRKIMDVAWDKLGPYRQEADAAVAAANEAVALAKLERGAALEQLDATVQQVDDLRRQLDQANEALAAAESKAAQLGNDNRVLSARYRQLEEFFSQRAAEAEAFRASVAKEQEARSREHAEALVEVRREHAEVMATERARLASTEARWDTAMKEMKEEHRQREALAGEREENLRKQLEAVGVSLHQVERDLAAVQAQGRQLTQRNDDIQGNLVRQQEENEVLRNQVQHATVTRAALEAEVRLLREQIKGGELREGQ